MWGWDGLQDRGNGKGQVQLCVEQAPVLFLKEPLGNACIYREVPARGMRNYQSGCL